MAKYKLHLRYIYTFYNFDEILSEDVLDEEIEVGETARRFTLAHQEDSGFILSELQEDYRGKYVIVTYPNKDKVLVHISEDVELEYDEYFSAMGDNNHNVYVGTFLLEEC